MWFRVAVVLGGVVQSVANHVPRLFSFVCVCLWAQLTGIAKSQHTTMEAHSDVVQCYEAVLSDAIKAYVVRMRDVIQAHTNAQQPHKHQHKHQHGDVVTSAEPDGGDITARSDTVTASAQPPTSRGLTHTTRAGDAGHRRTILHSYMVALGDLHRYTSSLHIDTLRHTTPHTHTADAHNTTYSAVGERVSELLRAAEEYYANARVCDVHNGKVWNQLGVLALLQKGALAHTHVHTHTLTGEAVRSETLSREMDLVCTAAYR